MAELAGVVLAALTALRKLCKDVKEAKEQMNDLIETVGVVSGTVKVAQKLIHNQLPNIKRLEAPLRQLAKCIKLAAKHLKKLKSAGKAKWYWNASSYKNGLIGHATSLFRKHESLSSCVLMWRTELEAVCVCMCVCVCVCICVCVYVCVCVCVSLSRVVC